MEEKHQLCYIKWTFLWFLRGPSSSSSSCLRYLFLKNTGGTSFAYCIEMYFHMFYFSDSSGRIVCWLWETNRLFIGELMVRLTCQPEMVTSDSVRVFINKTLSTETVFQQDVINRDYLSTWLIVRNLGQGWGPPSVTVILMYWRVRHKGKCVYVWVRQWVRR